MKKLFFIVWLILGLCLFLKPAEAGEKKFWGNINLGWFSQDNGKIGSYLYGSRGGDFQNFGNINFGNKDIYGTAGVWHSLSPNGGMNSDKGDEMQYYLGITKRINFSPYYANFSLIYTYYNFSGLNKGLDNSKGDIHGLAFWFSVPEFPYVQPYSEIEWRFPVKKNKPEKGLFYRVGLKKQIKIPMGLLNFNSSVAGNDGVHGFKPTIVSHFYLGANLLIKLGSIDFIPSLNFKMVNGNQKEGGVDYKDRFWVGIQMNLNF